VFFDERQKTTICQNLDWLSEDYPLIESVDICQGTDMTRNDDLRFMIACGCVHGETTVPL
jgi:hypothetical protein